MAGAGIRGLILGSGGGLKRLWADERAQATTEYILIMGILVTMAVSMVRKLIKPAFEMLEKMLRGRVEGMFKPKALHQLNVRGR